MLVEPLKVQVDDDPIQELLDGLEGRQEEPVPLVVQLALALQDTPGFLEVRLLRW